MGLIWDAIKSRITGSGETAESPAEEQFVEAAGVNVENEEGWRRLTGDSSRALTPLSQYRMRELALYMWRQNPVANRLIELPVAFLLAEGIKVEVDDEEAQDWINAFWEDPINCMDLKLVQKVREMSIYGQQCWPVFVNEINGHVRLGYLDPDLIETVVTDPDNIEQVIGIVCKRDKKGNNKRFRVIINGPETVFSERTREIRASFEDGECFYFRINALSNDPHGASDLLSQLDWLDGYDQAMLGELERWEFLRAFIFDCTIKGATPEQVAERAREITTPSPGTVRIHNDSEVWNVISPNLNAGDSEKEARLFRNHVLGGGTLPEHWYGGGGDVNRASAAEMGEPTFKVFTMRQTFWRIVLTEVLVYAIRQRAMAILGNQAEELTQTDEYRPRVIFPELTARDTTKYAAALQQVVVAVIAAISNSLLSRETGIGVIALTAGQLGMEIDAQAELEKAMAEKKEESENDAFTLGGDNLAADPPAADDDGQAGAE